MELRVRFAETDQMGVAHHAAYVVWLEAARVEWLRDLGLSYRDLEAQGVSLAVTGLDVRYRSAARFDDRLRIEVVLDEARSRRLRFGYRIVRIGEDAGPTRRAGATVPVVADRDHRPRADRSNRGRDAAAARLARRGRGAARTTPGRPARRTGG